MLVSERSNFDAGLPYAVLEAEIARVGLARGDPPPAKKSGGEKSGKPLDTEARWTKRTLKLDQKEREVILARATAHLQRLHAQFSSLAQATQPVLIEQAQVA